MTLPLAITLTITGALVLAGMLIGAFLLGRYVDRSRVRRERKRVKGEIDRLMAVDPRDFEPDDMYLDDGTNTVLPNR